MSEWKGSDIGDIPIEAKLIELGECLELIIDHRGKTPRKLGSDWVESGIPAISAKNIHSGSLTNHEDIRFVTKEIYERWMGDHDVETGDCLLVSEGATLGETLIWKYPLPIVLSQRVFCLRVDKSILDPYYFYYYVTTDLFQNQIIGAASGSTVMGLRQSVLLKLLVPVVDLGCQKLIGELLSSLDDKIDLLHRQNQTLEQMAETLFRQWFVEEADEGWGVGTLNDVLTVKGGTTPSTKNPEFWDGDIHWTSPRDITTLNSIYLFDTERKITEAGLKKISSGLLPKGTLLMSSRAPVGVLAFAEIPIAINQGYIAILDEKGFSKEFLFLWLKTNMDYVQSYANGSTFLEISKSAFKSLEIQIPPEELRNEFQEWIMPNFSKIKSNQTQIRTLTALRDTLLPKLMSGEVRVEMDATAKMEEA